MSDVLTQGLTKPLTYPLTAALGSKEDGSAAVVLPTIAALSASFESESNTFATAVSATAAEKYAIDRFIKYLKFAGFWTRNAANTNAGIWLMCQSTEAKCLVNILHPGTKDLTKTGAPTFAAFDGVTTASVSNYYDSGIAINTLSQNSASIGGVCLTNNAGASGAYDMGAVDGSNNGIRMMSRSSADVMAGAVNGAAVGTVGASTDWALPAFKALSRTIGASFGAFNHGINRITQTSASVAGIVSAATVSFLFSKTAAAVSQQKWGLFFLLDGLSDQEMAYMAAASKVLVDSYRNGLPAVQPAGYGDAAVTKDVIVYGTSMSAIHAAYEAKRQGRSVALVCDWMTESVDQLGGMPANGLGWVDIDTTVTTPTCAIFREMGKEINTRIGHTDANSQPGMSIGAQCWNIQVRKMLDPNRSTGNLIGLDIPVYFSTGLRSITKDGSNKILTMTTNDGRVFTGSVFCGEDYEGDLVYLSGVPYTSGREAFGTGVEAINGYRISQRSKPGDDTTANAYAVDPYVTAGVPASGLLSDIIVEPGYTTGQAYPSLQGFNFRLQSTNSAPRRAPFTGGYAFAQPSGYSAARHETLLRYLEACVAAGHTPARDDILTFTRTVAVDGSGTVSDLNNAAGVSSDVGQSGDRYLAAGFSISARLAVLVDIVACTRGMLYTLATDARVPVGIKNDFLTNRGLDATAFLDMVSWRPLYWPGMLYRREPTYQLNNAASGGTRLDGNDVAATDGTTPTSIKTVACIAYPNFDYHMSKWIAYDASDGGGVNLWRQGGYSDSRAGGTNKKAPWPMEASMPVKADCPNLLTSTCPSMTKIAFSAARMEQAMSQAAQANGIIAALAVEGGIAVQDVSYTTVRSRLLATIESVAPTIPQVN